MFKNNYKIVDAIIFELFLVQDQRDKIINCIKNKYNTRLLSIGQTSDAAWQLTKHRQKNNALV